MKNLNFCAALIALVCSQNATIAADFHRDIIYQVFTDRFYNGRKDNDDPPQSKGMFDASRKNWHAYWGGDLAGVREKLPYIKNLGCTAIWISPCIDNMNKPDNDSAGGMVAPYHGYHARDFMRIEEHFGDAENTWKDFDALIAAAHALGIRVYVDMPMNHTSPYNHGEYGALYDSGQFKSDVENDRNKYFHHLPLVNDYTDPYQLQYGTIFYLGDLDQENQYVDTYLKEAAARFQSHGADGTRLDAAKHINWGWQHVLASSLFKKADHLILGEWWLTGIDDPLYKDAVKFAAKSGISLFDFPLAYAIRKTFTEGDLRRVEQVISQENRDFNGGNQLITFIDNHDMSRFPSINKDPRMMQLALGLLLTTRGIPSIYYGTEQYLHDDTKGGEDPYDRPMMEQFDQSTDHYKIIQKLAALRHSSAALSGGSQKTLYCDKDVYVFERRSASEVSVVAISLADQPRTIKLSSADLPEPGSHDSLQGILGGKAFNTQLSLAPQSLAIWCFNKTGPATISAIRPPAVSAGKSVTIYGSGLVSAKAKLMVGGEEIKASTWEDTKITFNAPLLKRGKLEVKIENCNSANDSVATSLFVMENKLALMRFVVPDLHLSAGEKLYISGSSSALGAGSLEVEQMAGPMLVDQDGEGRPFILALPLPADQEIDAKLVVCDSSGRVLRTEINSRKVKVPLTSTAIVLKTRFE